MFRVTTTILVFLASAVCHAQYSEHYKNHIHYTTEDGLPQSFITGLAQDKQGYIWVATRDGLARFDGANFIRYAPGEENPNQQISTNQINDLYLDKNNDLWIYNFNDQIDKIDLNSGIIEKNVQPILSIPSINFRLKVDSVRSPSEFFKDENGLWYAGGSREYRLFDNSNIKLLSLFKEYIQDTTITSGFTSDQEGNLWSVIGSQVLLRSDSSWAFSKIIPVNKVPQKKYQNYQFIIRMRYLKGKRLFIQIPNAGGFSVFIMIYDIDKDEFRRIDLPYETKFSKYIEAFTYANNGDLIFDYHGKILRLSKNEEITLLWEYPFQPTLEISKLMMDRSDNLWVGTNTGGLFSVDTKKPAFKAFEYDKNFLHDLLKHHLDDSLLSSLKNWDEKNWAYGFRYEYDLKGNLYWTNEFGYSNERKIYRNGKRFDIESTSTAGKILYGIATQGDHVWAISREGEILKFSKNNEILLEKNFIQISDEAHPVDIAVDEKYQWVINTTNQLYQLENGELRETFNLVSPEIGQVFLKNDIKNDSILWIGTIGGGLMKWNKVTKKLSQQLTKKEGLPNNNMAGMVQDSLGNIWLSTFNGLAKIEGSDLEITTFGKNDGLHGSEFNRHHAFEFPNGQIAFGGPTGYTIFNPYALGETNFQPNVSIAQLYINNQPLNKNLTNLTELQLSYDENSVVLDAAAMQFNDPSANKFRYKLIGFNNDWVNNESNQRIRFDNLAPGSYNLLLNVSNTNGIWSDHIRELTILISPPIWKTWWAYISYVILILLLVFVYWKRHKKRLFEKQQLLFKEKEAKRFKEIDSIKTRFFSNITHEFRTPLTLILSPLEKELREKKHSSEVIRILESNYRQGTKLLDLVNQLLDISKLESGQMQTHKSIGDIELFFNAIVNQFHDYAKERGINLHFSNRNVEGQYLLEKSHLEKITMNLLSNALKFNSKGGSVSLTIYESENNQITIEVTDTGLGIADDQLEKLFDRFYQVDGSDNRIQEGTGIGLSLVKELTDLIGGTIDVKSKLGDGSSFILKLPLEKVLSNRSELGWENASSQSADNLPIFLVVEDNDELRRFIVESLEKKGKVLHAANGQEGWEIIEKELPDVIISDVMMPIMNGYDLCEKVKTDLRTSHISFIMLTAKTAQESKELGLGAGADDYLTKPFRVKELELRISNILTQKENIKQHYREKLLTKDFVEPATKPKDKFLDRLYEFLDENLSDSNLKLEDIAKELGMSKSTLNRKMRSLLDISTADFVQRYRIQKATLYLSEGDRISEVAYKVGFESPSYFSQCFKDVYAQSPSEYQKSAL